MMSSAGPRVRSSTFNAVHLRGMDQRYDLGGGDCHQYASAGALLEGLICQRVCLSSKLCRRQALQTMPVTRSFGRWTPPRLPVLWPRAHKSSPQALPAGICIDMHRGVVHILAASHSAGGD